MALVSAMQAVCVSLLPRAAFPSSPAHLSRTLSNPLQTSQTAQNFVLVCFS